MSQKNMQECREAKSLPEIFKELQEARYGQQKSQQNISPKKKQKIKIKRPNILLTSVRQAFLRLKNFRINKYTVLKLCTITGSIFILAVAFVSKNYIFAANEEKPEEQVEEIVTNEFEVNDKAIELESIIAQNVKVVKTKKVSVETREIEYKTEKRDNATLPTGEEKIIQPGIKGKEEVNIIRTYENDKLIDEKITNTTLLEEPTKKIVEVGTSKFLSERQVHIGDYMFVSDETVMRENKKKDAKEICKIPKYSNIRLLGADGDWCKISYETKEGYVLNKTLTSEHYTPGITDKNRIQVIKSNLRFNMPINKPSGLTLQDFKRILSNNPNDKNKIFEQNAQVFYEVEQKYKVNGLFIAALGIHESGWGTSKISQDKKNLFGYGAYDRDPYNSSYTFEDYKDGIELVAKIFAKYYLNLPGTKIYDNEIAQGKYYNGPTISGANVRYASDEHWAEKVFKHMTELYDKL